MKIFLKTFFITGVPFGIGMSLLFSHLHGVNIGIISGIMSGLLFGLFMSIFLHIQKKKFQKLKPEIIGCKEFIHDGPANHWQGIEGVGGWLYLTPDEIIFKSHSMNLQDHQLIVPLKQIFQVEAVLTAGFIPNGLKIISEDGTNEKFVVTNRKEWVRKILETKSLL